jgi:hypothetical protein
MAIDPITAALEIGGKLIDKLWPDPAQRDAAKLELLRMQQSGELAQLTAETELAKGQLGINTEEAKNSSVFVSGWRPAVGWTCVLGLLYTFLLRPLLAWSSGIWEFPAPPPLDMGDLLTLLLGMLGLGSLRTAEKFKGVAR